MPTKRTKKPEDAIAMLKADHAKVKKMFKQFERLHEDEAEEESQQLAAQICSELKVHTSLEEEIFYPQVRAALDEDDLLDEAEVEHASAKDLIAQIESTNAGDDKFAAKVKVLGEYVNHHVEEEENEMFPKVRKSELDLDEMAARMLARKHALQAEMGIESGGELPAGALPAGKRKSNDGRSHQSGRA
jgi:hemerythrin-like domain-containing protein